MEEEVFDFFDEDFCCSQCGEEPLGPDVCFLCGGCEECCLCEGNGNAD